MITHFFSFLSLGIKAVGAAVVALVLPATSFSGHVPPQPVRHATTTEVVVPFHAIEERAIRIATSSPPAVPTIAHKSVRKPVFIPKKVATTTPRVRVIAVPKEKDETAPVTSTSTVSIAIGTTTLAVKSVPLLFGGTAHAGESVPVSYLQITNTGSEGALLKGFWFIQNGSASTTSIISLSTVDDRGGSRGSSTIAPFQNGSAFAPINAFFAPGQMRLFTIKAILTRDISPYLGTTLMLNVSSIETTAGVQGTFPIRGTTWTIGQ